MLSLDGGCDLPCKGLLRSSKKHAILGQPLALQCKCLKRHINFNIHPIHAADTKFSMCIQCVLEL
jgi:hypothetical protein